MFAPAVLAVEIPPLSSIERACELIGNRLASIATKDCLDAGLRSSLTGTVEGQPILWRDIRSQRPQGNTQRILLLGGIHGDEFSSVSIVFQWMKQLANDRFQPFYWRIVPCLNPDGLLKVPETRTNASGVDLNRNFPTPDWNETALPYWERRTGRDPRRFPGRTPLSEPETRWLTRHIERFRPHAIVTVHAPYGILDYDGPQDPPQKLGFLRLRVLGAYPGSLGNYAGVYLGVPVITLELPHAGLIPNPAQSARLWGDMLAWLDENLPEGSPLKASPLYREPWRATAGTTLAPGVPLFSDWTP
ncbi:MAG TPA: M14 family murein peptide amidase A [Verrucomicrobiae bacterium]|nr:M14 family murein peptide amidase A [Verrucomicrobiae bacterium]